MLARLDAAREGKLLHADATSQMHSGESQTSTGDDESYTSSSSAESYTSSSGPASCTSSINAKSAISSYDSGTPAILDSIEWRHFIASVRTWLGHTISPECMEMIMIDDESHNADDTSTYLWLHVLWQ